MYRGNRDLMSASQYILESPRPCQGVGVTSQTSDLKKLKAQPSQAYAKPVGVSPFTDSCLLSDLALCGVQIQARTGSTENPTWVSPS